MATVTLESLAKDVEDLKAKNAELEAQNNTLAEKLEQQDAPQTVKLTEEVEARIVALEKRPVASPGAQESVSVKKKKEQGIPKDTFKYDGKNVRLTVGGIRHKGKRITAREILDMKAADRNGLIKMYKNIVDSVK